MLLEKASAEALQTRDKTVLSVVELAVNQKLDRKVPHAIFISHAAQARVFGQFQSDFHLARV